MFTHTRQSIVEYIQALEKVETAAGAAIIWGDIDYHLTRMEDIFNKLSGEFEEAGVTGIGDSILTDLDELVDALKVLEKEADEVFQDLRNTEGETSYV